AACRAVICPAPACSTWPMITYCTWSGATSARSRAAAMATPPSSLAGLLARAPSRRPTGVRAPPTMTGRRESLMSATIPSGIRKEIIVLPLLTRLDHVGIACRDLDRAVALYQATFGLEVASLEVNEEQGVREAMLRVGAPGATVAGLRPGYVQLLEPLSPGTPVGKFLARRGEGLHHVGYE